MAVTEEVVLIGANKQPNGLDFSSRISVAAFGASKTVALWRPFGDIGVFQTLKGHSKEVTGVKFIPGTDFLVSTAEDGDIIVWYNVKGTDNFQLHQKIAFHNGSICALTAGNQLFATGGVDGNIAVFSLTQSNDDRIGNFEHIQTVTIKKNFYPTCLALQEAYGDNLLAIGGTSNDVYVCKVDNNSSSVTLTLVVALKGHEDWMKCLAWTKDGDSYLLSLGCQDRYIRLWRVRPEEQEDSSKLVLLANRKEKLDLSNDQKLELFSEALIMGHDDWISGLVWRGDQLLLCSADTALMIWEMDSGSGIWVCTSRLGEMSIKGASTATGASGGFWLCLWIENPEDQSQLILANGKTGSFRVYKRNTTESSWKSELGISGPNREVTDLVWSDNGEFFYATSLDQTTRLVAPIKEHGWREIARPQIHGYDMMCIDNISATRFVSGGDEKVLRVFEMTGSTSEALQREGILISNEGDLPETATLPVLGLSNKADNENDEVVVTEGEEQDPTGKTVETAIVPTEDVLQRLTLYPEIEKLYGHGYEITCCCATPDYIASACRSNTNKHAVIRVFDTSKFQALHVLEGHNLTITSMAFSPNNEYLIAVSRDRQLSLWHNFELVLIYQAHSRIIWDCAWINDEYFVTGSRDKLIKLWKVGEEKAQALYKFGAPVMSIDSIEVGGKYRIAVGLEDGGIVVVTAKIEENEFEVYQEISSRITPADRVSKLAWGKPRGGRLLLGVGSADHSLRIYSIE